MSVNLRFPHISSGTDAEKLAQMQSYLHQLVEQLNWALMNVDIDSEPHSVAQLTSAADTAQGDTDPQLSFNSIKALIIKSADIVNAYYEEINKRLEGVYVAESDFGTYTEETSNQLKMLSNSVEELYENTQTIRSNVEGVQEKLIDVEAHVRSGLLYYDENGIPVYGLEIGQRDEVDGVETFNKYARFTSDQLTFYDNNGNEVAYISDRKLHITQVEVVGSFSIGRLVDTALPDGSVVTKYVVSGGGE